MATRILLVEDDATIGEVLAASLRSHAYDVIWERTGAAALTCAAAGAVDLIVLDLGLPDLEGTEVCRLLRRAQPGCVLVILTARSAEMDVVVGLDSGADDYLIKPVRLAEFHARLRAHLRRNDAATGTAREVRRFGDLVVDVATTPGHRGRTRTAPASQGVRPAGPSCGRAGCRAPPRDTDVRRVGRTLVRLDEDPRRPRGGAAQEDRGDGRGDRGRGTRDRHDPRPRVPTGTPDARGAAHAA